MRIRTAELVGGLSLATDMGAGLPLQSAVTATVLATRMAIRIGLAPAEQRATYWATVLRFIGCSSVAPETAQMGAGDDTSMNYALAMCDLTDPADVAASLDRHWARRADPEIRRQVIRAISEDLSQMLLSRRTPVGDRVPELLGYMYDRYDGVASYHAGEDIPVPARLSWLAAECAIVLRSLGRSTALELIRARRGTQFCPASADLLDRDHDALLAGLDAPSCWDIYLDAEPGGPADVYMLEFMRPALRRGTIRACPTRRSSSTFAASPSPR